MAKLKISALEKAVMANIQYFGSSQSIPQNILTSGRTSIKSNQVGAVVNNMVSKGLIVRQKDLFGTNISLTRSGKIQITKIMRSFVA